MKRVELNPPERHKGNGQPKIEGKYFTRASSLAKTLEDQGGLINWKAKMAAAGVAQSNDLRALAATLKIDDYRWRDVVERACEQAGASSAADMGTSIHTATEALDYGESTDGIPEDVLADATAYRNVLDEYGLKPVLAEVFVANRELRSAGSFDRLVEDADGNLRILDIKTVKAGRDPEKEVRFKGLSWSVQTATYANALPYDSVLGVLTWDYMNVATPDRELAYVAAIPRGSGECYLVDVDLTAGYQLAQLAAKVRDARRTRPASVRLPQQELITKEGSD